MSVQTREPVVPNRTQSIPNVIRTRRLRNRANRVVTSVAVLILVGIPLLAMLPLPHNPVEPDTAMMAQPPSLTHWFGTDSLGMDVYSRTIAAGQSDLPISIAATLLALLVGVPIGLFATSGRVGDGVLRVVDAFAALPMIVIAVVAIQLMGGGETDVILAIAVVAAPRFVRLTRASAIHLRHSRYVEAAIATGCSPIRVAFNHIFRNAYGVVLVQATLTAAQALGAIAALNFLGVGRRPPAPSWGGMIDDGATMLIDGAWWAAGFPSLAILLVIASLNIVAGALENRIERVEAAR